MSETNSRISDAERLVMKVIWQKSPMTASLIVERLKSETDWSPKTIQTLIARLVKKEVLGVNKEDSLNQYYPLVSQEVCMREETNSFLHKVYDGSLHLLLTNFVKNEKLSMEEIQELRSLLDEKMK
ncbi:MAG TPA: BlaI/MecI/CopY family transcriptional regulator [Ruminiclostridium sp.]